MLSSGCDESDDLNVYTLPPSFCCCCCYFCYVWNALYFRDVVRWSQNYDVMIRTLCDKRRQIGDHDWFRWITLFFRFGSIFRHIWCAPAIFIDNGVSISMNWWTIKLKQRKRKQNKNDKRNNKFEKNQQQTWFATTTTQCNWWNSVWTHSQCMHIYES